MKIIRSNDQVNYVSRLTFDRLNDKYYGSSSISKDDNMDRNKREKAVKKAQQMAAANFIIQDKDYDKVNKIFNSDEAKTFTSKVKWSKAVKKKRALRIKNYYEKNIEATNVFLDLERSGGQFHSEIIQLSCISGSSTSDNHSLNLFVWPQGEIDNAAAFKSHKIQKRDGRLYQNNKETIAYNTNSIIYLIICFQTLF